MHPVRVPWAIIESPISKLWIVLSMLVVLPSNLIVPVDTVEPGSVLVVPIAAAVKILLGTTILVVTW